MLKASQGVLYTGIAISFTAAAAIYAVAFTTNLIGVHRGWWS